MRRILMFSSSLSFAPTLPPDCEQDEIDRDISGRCFICGIDRFVFDQLGEGGNGFEEHITNDHNMWK